MKRAYRQVARAESAAATGERILDAAVEVFWEGPSDHVSLDEVARRAGVTVQTVIRRFGNRDGLFAAAAAREMEKVRERRDEAEAGDVPGAVRVLLDHYERLGDPVMRLLAEEERSPGLRDERLLRVRAFFDVHGAATALGVLPQPGTVGEKALLLLRGFGLRA